METKTFWVGDRPAGTWTFEVLNQRTGAPENLGAYTTARVKLLDSRNREVELADELTRIADFAGGVVTFNWPQESVFTEPGRYVMQLELSGLSARRHTTVQEILVRELGGVGK